MIGAIASDKSFKSTLKYIFKEEKKVKVVYGNFPEAIDAVRDDGNLKLLIEQFEQLTKNKPNIKKPCYHLKFSPAINDNLTYEDWSELSGKLLEELDLNGNQAIAVLHRDTLYPDSERVREHLHLVINKIDYQLHSNSHKLYYDYFRIQRFLRKFEIEKNLTIVNYDYKPVMQQPQEFNERTENKILMGDWLKGLDDLQEFGNDLRTREPELTGIDLVSYGITSTSSIVKIVIASIPKAETIEDRQKLEELLTTASTIPISEIANNNNHQKLLVEEFKKKLTPADIPEFTRQAQKFFKAQIDEIEQLPSKKKEEHLTDSNLIFERAQIYLKTVRSMLDRLPSDYGINDNSNFQIDLEDTPNFKTISISFGDRQLYKAQTLENGKWQEQINLLNDRQQDKLNHLPQNEEEVMREFAGRKVGSFFAEYMNRTNQHNFNWTSNIENGKPIVYSVSISNRSKHGITISVTDSSGKGVFKSQIANSGSINVEINRIPASDLKHLANYIKTQNIPKQKNENQKRQRQTFGR